MNAFSYFHWYYVVPIEQMNFERILHSCKKHLRVCISTYLLIFNKFCSWTFWKTSIITILNFVVLESSITSITKFLTYLKDQSHQSQSFWSTWKFNHINHSLFEDNHINLNKYKTLTTLVFSKHTRKIVRCTLKVQNTTNTKWQVHCTWHSLGEILFEKAQKLFTLLN